MPQFKLWSETNSEARKYLKPDLGLRSWDDIPPGDRKTIFHFLKTHFYKYENMLVGDSIVPRYIVSSLVQQALFELNHKYKVRCIALNYFICSDHETAALDLINIFTRCDGHDYFEFLSIFINILMKVNNIDAANFISALNDVFEQFYVNCYVANNQFMPKQDQKIIEEIYEPVLKVLSNKKWIAVNRKLAEAFSDYYKKDYSGVITHLSAALEAYLQILIYGEIGKGTWSDLIATANKKCLLPADKFSQDMVNLLKSSFAQNRKLEGDAHPAKGEATPASARLFLNLAMVFLQHSMTQDITKLKN